MEGFGWKRFQVGLPGWSLPGVRGLRWVGLPGFGGCDKQACRDSWRGGLLWGWVNSGLQIKATRFTTFPQSAQPTMEMMENRLVGVQMALRISGAGYGVDRRLTPIGAQRWARAGFGLGKRS